MFCHMQPNRLGQDDVAQRARTEARYGPEHRGVGFIRRRTVECQAAPSRRLRRAGRPRHSSAHAEGDADVLRVPPAAVAVSRGPRGKGERSPERPATRQMRGKAEVQVEHIKLTPRLKSTLDFYNSLKVK